MALVSSGSGISKKLGFLSCKHRSALAQARLCLLKNLVQGCWVLSCWLVSPGLARIWLPADTGPALPGASRTGHAREELQEAWKQWNVRGLSSHPGDASEDGCPARASRPCAPAGLAPSRVRCAGEALSEPADYPSSFFLLLLFLKNMYLFIER